MRFEKPDAYGPCPCGSGRKYRFCCFPKDREAERQSASSSWLNSADDPDFARDGVVCLDLDTGGRLNEEGMRLLERGQYDAAKRKFQASINAAPLIPTAHNNLALVTFAMGDVEESIRMQEQTLRKIPLENVFGMSSLVHYYLAAGRRSEAESLADDVVRRQPHDVSALGKQCDVLARLGRHGAILPLVEAYDGELDDAVCYFSGMAAANLGLYDRASAYLRRVARGSSIYARARKYTQLIETGKGPGTIEGNWPYFGPQDVLPREVLMRLVDERSASPAPDKKAARSAILVEAFAALLNEGAGAEKDIVECLGRMDCPRATELVKKIAEGTFGTDDLRLAAVQALVSKGVWDGREPHKVWVKGKWVDMVIRPYGINPEAASAPMPPGMLPLYEKATIALRKGEWKEGGKLWRRFIEQAPAFHPAYHNLAVALMQQNRNAEAETLLRKAMEIAPGYVFAPCTLAVLYLEERRAAEARGLLDAVVIPEETHPEAMACYCTAQTQVAVAEGDMAKAIGWLDMAATVDPENPNVKKLQSRLALPQGMEKLLSRMRERQREKNAKLRERVLSIGTALEDCYGTQTKMQLAGMARAVGVDAASAARKEEILHAVCAALRNPDTVRCVLAGLQPADEAALKAVIDSGGRMDYDAFTRAHGTDSDDPADWGFMQPKTVLGRLKCRGLLVEATVDRRESVFIPGDLRLDPGLQ